MKSFASYVSLVFQSNLFASSYVPFVFQSNKCSTVNNRVQPMTIKRFKLDYITVYLKL